MTAGECAAARAAKDSELLDWFAEFGIAVDRHPHGWEVWWRGLDGKERPEGPLLMRGVDLREALARAVEMRGGQDAAQGR